jgi:hypothetical protein
MKEEHLPSKRLGKGDSLSLSLSRPPKKKKGDWRKDVSHI